MSDGGAQRGVLIFAGGVVLGAAVCALAVAAYASSRPEPKPPEPTKVVCEVAPCPACAACPDPQAALPAVREPPQEVQSVGASIDNGESVSERSCERARQRPMQVSDAKLAACARSDMLGSCHLRKGSAGAACAEYASVDELCAADGKCGPPLNGDGCVDGALYGSGTSFFNCSGDKEAVAGCMMRKLAKAGYCKK